METNGADGRGYEEWGESLRGAERRGPAADKTGTSEQESHDERMMGRWMPQDPDWLLVDGDVPMDFVTSRTEILRGSVAEEMISQGQRTRESMVYTWEAQCTPGSTTSHMGRRNYMSMTRLLLVLLAILSVPASAVLIPFENCLSDSRKNDLPLGLQVIPQFVDVIFNTTDPAHNLQVLAFFNVNGSWTPQTPLPPPEDTEYWLGNDTDRGGKIIKNPFPDTAAKLTTATTNIDVLTYKPYVQSRDFCSAIGNGTCPLGPSFYANQSNPHELPYLAFSHNMYSTYAFTTLSVTSLIIYGDIKATHIGCISVEVTPDIGTTLEAVLAYVPLAILILVGIATAFAAVFSPWGSTNTFRWTTNYGRDQDLLRLVTPGFGDCLQYIQFIALTGGLTLNYPGFYQPIVSKVAWSALMFNQSFVEDRVGFNSLVDGIYRVDADLGLDRIRQLVGMGAEDDVWAGMLIWLMVILASVLVIIQLGFLFRWALRRIQGTQEEDLRAKNFPFSAGNVIRVVFNYFLLPLVALSMFQLVAAGRSPVYTVALAVVCVVLIMGFAVLLFLKIVRTREKAQLFDDLPTLMLYGSLYNTYSDDAALFALVPIFLTFIRGIAIGAIQPSGIAQIVVLAICEVITILSLHAFRPFHSPTSMNAYHTFFSAVRFTTILLMISFSPSLGVTSGPKGWIGYAILLLHGVVLLFGFLLNAIQTIVEVAARLAGAGGDPSGAARGGLVKVFGMRQLSRRAPRRDAAASRQSQLSSAAMLAGDNERPSFMMSNDGRVRSQSAGSANLLLRSSTGLDSVDPYGGAGSQGVGGSSAYTPTTPGEASTFSFIPSQPASAGQARRGTILTLNAQDTADPYYRPPRARRPTMDNHSPGARSRGSWTSTGWANKRWSQQESNTPDKTENFEGPSISGRNTPVPLAGVESPEETGRSPADYTTREVDFYYGVRGPALNANIPNRRIKTGPADPTGPAASAAGWFKSLFGGKTKESGKGFEVVRSSRMPPGMRARNEAAQGETPPEGIPVATGVVRQSGPIDSDDESPARRPTTSGTAARAHDNPLEDVEVSDEERSIRISNIPPILPGIEVDERGIELPSRYPSKATTRGSVHRPASLNPSQPPGFPLEAPSRSPTVPRKSSRRKSQSVDMTSLDPNIARQHRGQSSLDSTRLPFDRSNSARRTASTRSTNPLDDYEAAHDPSVARGFFAGEERPTSMGYVSQHITRTVTPSNNPDFLGSSAEVIDRRDSNASSMEEGRQRPS